MTCLPRALCCALFIAVSGPLLAQDYALAPVEITSTSTSGRSGVSQSLVPGSAQRMLTGIEFLERSDDPCHIVLRHTGPNGGTAQSVSFTRCHNNANRREGNNSSRKVVTVQSGRAVVGVSVCLNRGEDKIKGISLHMLPTSCAADPTGRVNTTIGGRVTFRAGGSDQGLNSPTVPVVLNCTDTRVKSSFPARRTNCKTWKSASMCPPGQVVTGLTLKTRAGSSGRQIVQGLAVRCRDLIAN